MQKEIEELLLSMQEVAQPYQAAIEQLDSIPGIDTLSALTVVAEISATPKEHFSNSAKLCSWSGLSPRNDSDDYGIRRILLLIPDCLSKQS